MEQQLMINIIIVTEQHDIEEVKRLYSEFPRSANFHPETILAHFSQTFLQPDARLFLAKYDDKTAGTVGLSRLTENICEVRMLFVRPQYRGYSIGRQLMSCFLEEAQRIGYHTVRLYTIPTLQTAIRLYTSLGFHVIPPYHDKLLKETVFMEKELSSP
jgi:ribosomal protein S18 acetylase RimI-like enzyme